MIILQFLCYNFCHPTLLHVKKPFHAHCPINFPVFFCPKINFIKVSSQCWSVLKLRFISSKIQQPITDILHHLKTKSKEVIMKKRWFIWTQSILFAKIFTFSAHSISTYIVTVLFLGMLQVVAYFVVIFYYIRSIIVYWYVFSVF